MAESRKRIGRPPKPPTDGKKVSLGLKVTPGIKEALDNAARLSGRTQSQEAEYRLEQTFDQRPLLAAMELAFGRELGAIVIAAGKAMRAVREHGAVLGAPAADQHDQMIRAANIVLELLRPVPSPVPLTPEQVEALEVFRAARARMVGEFAADAFQADPKEVEEEINRTRDMMIEIAKARGLNVLLDPKVDDTARDLLGHEETEARLRANSK